MSKKIETKKQEDFLENYRSQVNRLQVLSRLAIRQFLGTRPDGDPRVDYLANLDAFKNLANVHLEVMMELVIKKSKDDFLKLQGEHLAMQVKAMEQDLCVTGWDNLGNPIFDLPRYMERTKLWPK
jgi:hypothetical protein